MIRVIVVDDQQLVRRGFRLVLQTIDDIEVVGEAAHGEEALAVITKASGTAAPVDVVLSDARMPVMDGVALVRACREQHPGLPVVVLTTFDDDQLVRDAVGAGEPIGDRHPEAPLEEQRVGVPHHLPAARRRRSRELGRVHHEHPARRVRGLIEEQAIDRVHGGTVASGSARESKKWIGSLVREYAGRGGRDRVSCRCVRPGPRDPRHRRLHR